MSAILRLDLPDYTRVTLTVLRKIFVQTGHSREEGAYTVDHLIINKKNLFL